MILAPLKRRKNRTPLTARRRICAWAGAMAMAFQLFIPLGQGLSAHNGTEIDSQIIVCKLMGGSAQHPDKNAPGSDQSYSCPICQIRCLGKSLLPGNPTVTFIAEAIPQTWNLSPNALTATKPTTQGKYPRAPPYFA